jgi:MoxR-like ATPase
VQDVAAPNDVPANKANTITPRQAVADVQSRVNASIIGQERVVERLIIALLANGG